MKNVSDSYVNITSGLGKANPRSILIVPLKINEEVHGVVEFASFRLLEKYEIEFVEKLAESIASTVASYKINARTARLLEESREQATKLVAQEEMARRSFAELKQIQEEAAKQGEQFVSFTTSVNHTLIRAEYDTKGMLLYANTKFLKKLEYDSNSEVEGKPISMFINKKDREWFNKIWNNLVSGGRHFEGDMKHVTKSGNDLWTMATYVSIRDSEGKPIKILFLGIDTTEQKKQSLDYEGQISALNLINIKAEFSHETGVLLNCNQNFLNILEYDIDEVKTKTVFDFISNEDIKSFKENWQEVQQGKSFQGQIKNKAQDGQEKWFQASYVAVQDMYGDIEKIVLIANDITEQKQIELKIREQSQQLQIQEEKLQTAKTDLSKKLDETRKEMKQQFKETETLKMLNEKTLEGMLDAVVTINKRNTITFFNKAAEDLWNLTREDVLGKPISAILPPTEESGNNMYMGNFFRYGEKEMIGTRTEVFILNSQKEQIPVLITLSEARIGKEYNLTAFIQNIEVELF